MISQGAVTLNMMKIQTQREIEYPLRVRLVEIHEIYQGGMGILSQIIVNLLLQSVKVLCKGEMRLPDAKGC
jgi:hypothetical protein